MISKIRKYQDSWLTKGILLLTALSFMSLFGVSGYIGSAGKNKAVIKVDKMELLQSDFMIQYNKQIDMARNMFGENLDDNVRATIMQQITSKNLSDMIISRTADKLNMSISDELIRTTVYSRAEFMDDYGNFNLNKMRRTIMMYGMSETDYIAQLKSEIKKQHLVYGPIENINVPKIVAEYNAKAKNLRKSFKYIKLDTDKTKIDRKISQEEIEQYYQDFILEFTNPEVRDLDFILISNEEAAKKIIPSEDEINIYYEEHLDKFETPEQRRVLQMVLGSEEEAINAKKDLDSGKDFYEVAKDLANQEQDDTDFGLVGKDMLIEEISTAAFSASINKIVGPVQSEFGWHIIKITEIKPMTKMDTAKAKEVIIEEIRKEQAYENLRVLTREIDDKIGGGASLKEIANYLNLKTYAVSGLTEDGNAKKFPKEYKNIITDVDFVDTAFSYNKDEVSQILETNYGLVLLSVKNIKDAHPKEISEVRGEIEKMWADNERSSIVQEIVGNVMNDLEDGDAMEDISSRFSLTMKKTKPLKRDETFEDLTSTTMFQLFQEEYNTPKILDLGNTKLIVISEKVKSSKSDVSEQDIDSTKALLKLNNMREYSGYLIDSYAKDLNINVNYKLIGLGE